MKRTSTGFKKACNKDYPKFVCGYKEYKISKNNKSTLEHLL
jgi:hypothetical protein